jgi:hypothetical protein
MAIQGIAVGRTSCVVRAWVLMDRGFPEFHVKKELYWPKGKTATAGAG